MKLAYLYLANYRVLKQSEFNFDSEHRYHYGVGKLTRADLDGGIDADFFILDPARAGRVDCVSAIVGENGTGKTTLAGALADLIRGRSALGNFVAVVSLRADRSSEGEHLEVFYRLQETDKLILEGFDCPESCRYNLNDKKCKFDLDQKLRLIYYSPLFTGQRAIPATKVISSREPSIAAGGDDFGADQIKDWAVRDVSRTAAVAEVFHESNRASPENAIILSDHRRLLDFICTLARFPQIEKDLDLGDKIVGNRAVVAMNDDLWHRHISDIKRTPTGYAVSEGPDHQLYNEDLIEGWRAFFVGVPETCLSTFAMRIFFYFSVEYLSSRHAHIGDNAEGLTEAAEALAKIVAIARNAKGEDCEELIIKELDRAGYEDDRFESLAELMRLAQKVKACPTIELNDRDNPLLKGYLEMMRCYLACRGEEDFLDFTFEKLFSAGEKEQLEMCSRLFDAFEDTVWGKARFHDVILFLDEVETALHPSWQRTVVERVIVMWETLASGCHAHIIFGSHSPVLLSDIPKQNVIMLYPPNQEKKTAMESDWEELPNTFGANIFDLYKLAFSQSLGASGSFSRKKIDDALKESALIVQNGFKESGARRKMVELSPRSQKVLALVGDAVIRKYIDGLKECGLL